MRFIYFASVREAIGHDDEIIELPDDILTIKDCLEWLGDRGEKYTAAIADKEKLRFALDQEMAGPETAIGKAKELAIFPPVTGG